MRRSHAGRSAAQLEAMAPISFENISSRMHRNTALDVVHTPHTYALGEIVLYNSLITRDPASDRLHHAHPVAVPFPVGQWAP